MATVRNPDQTRNRLIEAAYEAIYQNGYQGMRIDEVLERTGLKKGAMYHHFASKAELGYAVIDELLVNKMQKLWLEPLSRSDDPISALKESILSMDDGDLDYIVKHGCPLNNLAQEMSSLDDGFQTRLQNIFEAWIIGIAKRLTHGQEKGFVRTDIDCMAAATFIVASLEGCTSLLKASQDTKVVELWWPGMNQYLNSLRTDK